MKLIFLSTIVVLLLKCTSGQQQISPVEKPLIVQEEPQKVEEDSVAIIPNKEETPEEQEDKAKVKANLFHEEAVVFCKNKNFNTDYYILVDMSIPSGKNRFYLYNFNTKEIEFKCLTTHGTCDVYETNDNYTQAKFSNKAESHCSAKGKYKIAERGSSVWGLGIKYVLEGLESSNANAKIRSIVLHSWEIIPDNEVYPEQIALSWGCPAISNESFRYIDKFIQSQKNKSILLWIVE